MAQTPAQRLAAIEAAIAKIEGGSQSLSIGNRAKTYADYGQLVQARDSILAQISRADGNDRRVCEF
jgi:hypothetical protein